MKRRANGEGTLYQTTQKQKRPKTKKVMPECENCKNCKDRTICNNREDCNKCDICKNCTKYNEYCDKFYFYSHWVGQCSTKNGKRTSSVYGKNQKEAANKKNKISSDIQTGKYIGKSDTTLYMMMKEVIEDRKKLNETGDSAYITNKQTLKRLSKAEIVHKPIQKITTDEIKDFLATRTKYSDSIIKKDYGMLNAGFQRAIAKNIILHNPIKTSEFRKPRSKQPFSKVVALTVNEQRKFIQTIHSLDKPHQYQSEWLLSISTGMRMGEVLALDKEKDIDFEEKIIHVNNTLTTSEDENGKEITILGDRTKTYSGYRDIKMTADVEKILKICMKKAIDNKNNLLFCRENGNLITTNMITCAIKRFCEKYKITKNKNCTSHILRHSFATRQIESGMPAHILQKILGHKSVKETLDTYTDVFAAYENRFDENVYNYYQENGLLYDFECSEYEMVQREMANLVNRVKESHLKDKHKEQLKNYMNEILKWYEVLEEVG